MFIPLTPYVLDKERQAEAFAVALTVIVKDDLNLPERALSLAHRSGIYAAIEGIPVDQLTLACVRVSEFRALMKREEIMELFVRDGEMYTVLWFSKHLFRRAGEIHWATRAACLYKAAASYPQVVAGRGLMQFPGGLALTMHASDLTSPHLNRAKGRPNEALLSWLNVFYSLDARIGFEECLYPGDKAFAHWALPNRIPMSGMCEIVKVTNTSFLVKPDKNLVTSGTFEIPKGDRPEWCFERSLWPYEPNAYL